MLTLSGATGVTVIVANGIQRAFNTNPKWLALAIAEVISLFGVFASGGFGTDYFVGIVNGFLIFSASAGITEIGSSTGATRGGGRTRGARREFWTTWF
jgi:hypothetical protein